MAASLLREADAAAVDTEQTCGICLEDSKDPLNLPCGHSFCDGCLDEWRSRYGVKEEMRRKCPTCRAAIPPSKEMVQTLLAYRANKQKLEDRHDTSSEHYRNTCRLLKTTEELVGADWDGVTVLQDNRKQALIMPDYIVKAILGDDIKSVIKWINANREEDRANAKSSAEMIDLPALCIAAGSSGCNQLTLMTILLQLGANVNSRDNTGCKAIGQVFSGPFSDPAFALGLQARGSRLLLSWGANFFPDDEFDSGCSRSREFCIFQARKYGPNLPIYWSPSSGEGGARSSIYHHGPSSTARRASRMNTYPSATSTR